MTPSIAGAREALSLRAQILAAQRAVRDAMEREERLGKPGARASRPAPPAPVRQTLIAEISRVLLAADRPLLAREIRDRLTECREKSLAPALNRMRLSGAIKRHGQEGKYRYTDN